MTDPCSILVSIDDNYNALTKSRRNDARNKAVPFLLHQSDNGAIQAQCTHAVANHSFEHTGRNSHADSRHGRFDITSNKQHDSKRTGMLTRVWDVA